MMAASDQAHLELAATLRRVVFTQDADFLRLHSQGLRHAGIVYISQQATMAYVIRNLLMLAELLDNQDMQDHIEFL